MKLREERGSQEVKDAQNKRKAESDRKLRVERGPLQIKRNQNERKEKSRMNHMENNPEILRMQETNRKKLSRKKQRHENPEKLKEDQNKWQTKCRLVETEKGRLHKFLKRTMYNAVFTCCCCQRNLFECNVSKLTQHFISQIETKKPGIYASAIELDAENNPIMV